MDVDLTFTLGARRARPLRMRNPVMSAAGTFGYGVEYARLLDLSRIGAVVTKSTTLLPRAGAPMPRWVETPSGMLNAIGINNPGIMKVMRTYAPKWAGLEAPVIVSVAGETVDDYVGVSAMLEETEHVAGIELNISCPNVERGGVWFGSDPVQAAAVTAGVRGVTTVPLIVKLSPNAADIARVAQVVQDAGADAVSLVNTITGMVIDTASGRPYLGNRTGGLSGPAIRPVAVRMVWDVAQAVEIPVIGLGGITCADDALQFIMAGASAVQVGSAGFAHPGSILEVADGLAEWLRGQGLTSLDEVRGSALPARPSGPRF